MSSEDELAKVSEVSCLPLEEVPVSVPLESLCVSARCQRSLSAAAEGAVLPLKLMAEALPPNVRRGVGARIPYSSVGENVADGVIFSLEVK